MDPNTGLAGLFLSAFLSSTILPGNSEVVLAALLAYRPDLEWPALAVATLGNTAGALTSYAIGRFLPQPKTEPRALALARRYGVPALLLSWVPVIGDALCVASGWLRQPVGWATLAIAVGKFARYYVLAVSVLHFTR
jgi:membrane protein YqaA with SNARE-associated domain